MEPAGANLQECNTPLVDAVSSAQDLAQFDLVWAQRWGETIAKFSSQSWFLLKGFCNYFSGGRRTDFVVKKPHWESYLPGMVMVTYLLWGSIKVNILHISQRRIKILEDKTTNIRYTIIVKLYTIHNIYLQILRYQICNLNLKWRKIDCITIPIKIHTSSLTQHIWTQTTIHITTITNK